MFTVRVCCDLYGKKVNLEIPFGSPPSLGELQRKVDDVFTAEARAMMPPGGNPADAHFRTSRMQIYDDRALRWVELTDQMQLNADRCQVYAFRNNAGSPGRDVQQEMPPPRVAGGSGYSPRTGGSPSYGGSPGYASQDWRLGKERPNVPMHEKMRTVFDDFNVSRSGALSHAEMSNGFKNVGIDFATITTDELFSKADANRDQRVPYDEWQNWCGVYPNTLECVYFRGRDKAEEDEVIRGLRRIEDEMANTGDREAQLRQELAALQGQRQNLDNEHANLKARQVAFQHRRDTLEQQERDLMEQEIRLERQRDHLRAQEARFQAAANNFDVGAQQSASPRRAVRGGSPAGY